VDTQIWSVQQAAKYLEVGSRQVRYWIASGRIPAKKIGPTWVIGVPDLYAFEKTRKGGKREKK